MNKKALVGISVLLLAALALAACSTPAAPAAPTADANAAYTQAAATVAAQLTQTAEKNPAPSATPVPPTNTPTMIVPTATVTPQGGAAQGTATTAAGLPTATGVAAVVPTATKASGGAAPAPTTGDLAELVGQSPEDGTVLTTGGQVFNVQFTLKNTGTTTWSTAYTLRYYAGDKLGAPSDTNLSKEVKPGESITVVFQMTSPSSAATTNTVFVMSNKEGGNFYSMFIKLKFE